MDRRRRFELVYANHARAVMAYALRRADSVTAEDVVAEVFVVCWRRLDELPSEPLPWLLGVARRVLGNQRRGERRRAALGKRMAETALGESREVHASGDRVLTSALDRLHERDRELLLLIAWEGLSPTQAAAVLGVKPSTVRVRLMRARRRLAAAIVGEETAAAVPMEVSS